jgi:hypothetical protein
LSLFHFDELHRIGLDHMRSKMTILARLVAVVSAINRHGLAVL